MKKITALLALALLLASALSGCSLAPSDVTTLMRPPKLAGEQQAIQKTLEAAIGTTEYTLKYALEGKYRSAFILHDIDGDGSKEAIALYSPKSESAGTHVMVLHKKNGKWKKVADISGDGNEVERIDFGNYAGGSVDYLTVGWTEFTSSGYAVEVYKLNQDAKSGYSKLYSASFSDMAITDLNGDGRDDLLLLENDPNLKVHEARLVCCRKGRFLEMGKAPLDTAVSSYSDMYAVKLSSGVRGMLIDGYKNTNSMVTELVCWQGGKLTAPFYNKSRGVVTSTLRNVSLGCRDINSDGVMDIPFAVEMPGYLKSYYTTHYADKIWQITWCDYQGGAFKKVLNCVWNFSENYYFVLPKKWIGRVTVKSAQNGSVWDFREWNKTAKNNFSGELLFSVVTFSAESWNMLKNTTGLYRAFDQGGMVYCVRMSATADKDDALYLPLAQVLKDLRPYS